MSFYLHETKTFGAYGNVLEGSIPSQRYGYDMKFKKNIVKVFTCFFAETCKLSSSHSDGLMTKYCVGIYVLWEHMGPSSLHPKAMGFPFIASRCPVNGSPSNPTEGITPSMAHPIDQEASFAAVSLTCFATWAWWLPNTVKRGNDFSHFLGKKACTLQI